MLTSANSRWLLLSTWLYRINTTKKSTWGKKPRFCKLDNVSATSKAPLNSVNTMRNSILPPPSKTVHVRTSKTVYKHWWCQSLEGLQQWEAKVALEGEPYAIKLNAHDKKSIKEMLLRRIQKYRPNSHMWILIGHKAEKRCTCPQLTVWYGTSTRGELHATASFPEVLSDLSLVTDDKGGWNAYRAEIKYPCQNTYTSLVL